MPTELLEDDHGPSNTTPTDQLYKEEEDDVKMEVFEYKHQGPSAEKKTSVALSIRLMTKNDRHLWKFVFLKPENIACPVVGCETPFSDVSTLLEHYKECYPVSEDQVEERCPVCDQILQTSPKLSLTKHIQDQHVKSNKLIALDSEEKHMQVKHVTDIEKILKSTSHPTKDIVVEFKDYCLPELKQWEPHIIIPDSLYRRTVSQQRMMRWDEELRTGERCVCNIKGCSRSFNSKRGIVYHSKTCGFIYFYNCKLCNFLGREQQGLLKHMAQYHKSELRVKKSQIGIQESRESSVEKEIPEIIPSSPEQSLVTPPPVTTSISQSRVPKKRGRPRKYPLPSEALNKPKRSRGRPPKKQTVETALTSRRRRKSLSTINSDEIIPTNGEIPSIFDVVDGAEASSDSKENHNSPSYLSSQSSERPFQQLEVSRYSLQNGDLLDSTLGKATGKESILQFAKEVDQMIMAEGDTSSLETDSSPKSDCKAVLNQCHPRNSLLSFTKSNKKVEEDIANHHPTLIEKFSHTTKKKSVTRGKIVEDNVGPDTSEELENKARVSEKPAGVRRSCRTPKPLLGRRIYSYSEEEISDEASSYKATSSDESEEEEMDHEDIDEISLEPSEEEVSEPELVLPQSRKRQLSDIKREYSPSTKQLRTNDGSEIVNTNRDNWEIKVEDDIEMSPDASIDSRIEEVSLPKKRGRKPKIIDRSFKEEDLEGLQSWKGCYRSPQDTLRLIPNGILQEWETTRLKKKLIKCPLPNCTKTFGTALGLKYHYQRCGLASTWDCLLCSKRFDYPAKLATHFSFHKEYEGKARPTKMDSKNRIFTRDEYAQLYEQCISEVRHPQLMPDLAQWNLLTKEEYLDKLPIFSESIQFKEVARESQQDQVPWKRLNAYDTTDIDDSKNSVIFHTGGPVLSSSWCPTDDPSAPQYLALAASLDQDDLIRLEVPTPLIQVWNMGDLSTKEIRQKPYLSFAIKCQEEKQIISLQWCPSGCWQQGTRMGVLAVAFFGRTIHLYSVPHPEQLPAPASGDPPVYSAQPALILDARSDLQCSCFTWDPSPGHTILAAGFRDGHIAMWMTDTTSHYLRSTNSEGQVVMYPYRTYRCAMGDVHAVQLSLSKSADPNRIVVMSGGDHKIRWWDTTTECSVVIGNPTHYVHTFCWPAPSVPFYYGQTTFGGTDNIRVFSPYHKPEEATMVSSTPGELTCLDFSPWTQAIVTGDGAGNAVITPSSTYRPRLARKHVKKTMSTTPETVLRCRMVNFEEVTDFRFLYEHMVGKTGLVFSEFQLNHKQTMCEYKVDNYLLSALRAVKWNPNPSSDHWLLTSYTCGLCRISYIYLDGS